MSVVFQRCHLSAEEWGREGKIMREREPGIMLAVVTKVSELFLKSGSDRTFL